MKELKDCKGVLGVEKVGKNLEEFNFVSIQLSPQLFSKVSAFIVENDLNGLQNKHANVYDNTEISRHPPLDIMGDRLDTITNL